MHLQSELRVESPEPTSSGDYLNESIINPIRRFRRLFQAGLLFVLGQLFRKRLSDLRRHIGPSQSFQRLDHQARHVRQTGDFLVGPMLKFQLCGVPLIGLIRAVADIGPDGI